MHIMLQYNTLYCQNETRIGIFSVKNICIFFLLQLLLWRLLNNMAILIFEMAVRIIGSRTGWISLTGYAAKKT